MITRLAFLIRGLAPLLVMSLAVSTTACSIIPRDTNKAVINHPFSPTTTHVSRADFPNMRRCVIAEENASCFHPMFIGVSVSGGGARAANFGLGAMLQLINMGLYDEVTALSSVSGGSLAAAKVALARPETQEDFDTLANDFRQDFLSAWIGKSLYPTNIVKTLATGRNSTRTLADVFDQHLFRGATYGDLGKRGPGKPALYINGSLLNAVPSSRPLTTRGLNSPNDHLQGFTFTQEAFNELGSDLGKLKLAEAVAASGSYPGLFNSLTLQNFNSEMHGLARTKYLHVSDGGTSDNLGVDALIRAYGETLMGEQYSSCLLILIDAHVSNRLDQSGQVADLRTSTFDFLISPSFNRAFDLLLDRRRDDQLRGLGIALANDHPKRFNPSVVIPLDNLSFYATETSASRGRSSEEGNEMRVVGGKKVSTTTCAVWHIALDRLLELSTHGNRRQREAFRNQFDLARDADETPRDKNLIKLDFFVNAIETNYRLQMKGDHRCSAHSIQASLFNAAEQLLLQDQIALLELRKWLAARHRTSLVKKVEFAMSEAGKKERAAASLSPSYDIKNTDWRSPLSTTIRCNQ